ncbi:MAG: hypothetical protein ABI175_29430 [Polyangiales bacterium]
MKHLRLVVTGLLASALVTGAAGGCLGRTNPDDDELEAQGVDDSGAPVDSSVGSDTLVPIDTSPVVDTARPDTAPPRRDGFIDFFDIIPIPDSGPIGECATCVATNCSKQVNACLNDPDCRNGLACTVTSCLAGGGGTPDLACVLKCFGGDFTKAAAALSAFTCVTGKCGTPCGGLIGGIPGLPGGGGGSGGGSGGSGAAPAMSSPMRDVSADELRSMDPRTRFAVPREAFGAWSSELGASACAQGIGPCIAQ